ncbi:hypothetical protein CANTEDRAFT_114245 [Yamadazyma tenuis ATCC 10573]|uniref:Uncharacterized protein n=1 Tax=Candida tenuis (strain ATCC 10573 / BCRC 21748 / CBS 615 / JCM 9827 / NBRC 10315 / NRRL Y-1498 / VKM Y-70) TaxID=590646 RepID=G3B3L4_CANTC|nr:uncharacterized protein CANTEDRAFT_114245 [Yamadazyma tenuis ATCC 10573]EGV64181.1 hypothetical protein CANTEDRAFT_114245 [Yamadazyma tenuis ATCC 10573]
MSSHGSMPAPASAPSSISHPSGYTGFAYPGLTSMVNANSDMVMPKVEAQFVDRTTCTVCGKRITRDMGRHMRTHHPDPRFKCIFPREECDHKSQRFNRPYDFKKHLMNKHFHFDNSSVKKSHNLSNKLNQWGNCACGKRFLSNEWLDHHILTKDASELCSLLRRP